MDCSSRLAVLGNEKPRLTSRNIKASWCRIYIFPTCLSVGLSPDSKRSEASYASAIIANIKARPTSQWRYLVLKIHLARHSLINLEPMHGQINNDHISFSDSKSLIQILADFIPKLERLEHKRQLFLALANILRQPASLQEWARVLKPDPRWMCMVVDRPWHAANIKEPTTIRINKVTSGGRTWPLKIC